MRRLLRQRLAAAALVAILAIPVTGVAGAEPIYGEYWVRRDMMEILSPGSNLRESGSFSERERNAMENLLDDARWTFSGMIYGFSFEWTPGSVARDVEDQLSIEPLGLLPWGDPSMSTVAVVEENGFLYVQLKYEPDDIQASRLEAWNSQAFPVATGSGEVRAVEFSRRNALEEAIKQAVRAWLRAREFNRPREVTGKIAFTEFPETGLRANQLKASVSVRMVLDPLRHYSAD